MMKQYKDLKSRYADAFLFFRLGDFYEMFFDDAKEASRILNLTLTKRNGIPMCGVPFHAVDSYLGRLIRAGKKAAICEQLSDPSLPGIVERDVIRVVTPGTTFDERILDQKTNNFIASVIFLDGKIGVAFCDLTTGLFQVISKDNYEDLREEIFRFAPAECVIDAAEKNLPDFLKQFERMPVFPHQFWDEPYSYLAEHFGVKNLIAFGIENNPEIVACAAWLISYLKETQKTDLVHIKPPQLIMRSAELILDETAVRNLELFKNMRDGKREGSLISVIDITQTPMGGRLLRQWLIRPRRDKREIEKRLDCVEEIKKSAGLKNSISETLLKVLDIERLLGRIGVGAGNGREVLGIAISLKNLPLIKDILTNASSEILKELLADINDLKELDELSDEILASISENPPLSIKDGGLIRDGVNAELDGLRDISRHGKEFIQKLQQREIERTGINSLKVRYNQVFGYYIEITKANLAHAPADYMRKQTLVNCERFITPELKEYEDKILGAEEKIKELEYQLFLKLREKVKDKTKEIQVAAHVFAALDCLTSLALVAGKKSYCRPVISEEGESLVIKNGRHPVVEHISNHRFIPNDACFLDDKRLMLLTGPNMGGKSTYLRQTALIVLMAHVGSFVPAEAANIPLIDRIFTRVGANDNLAHGQSTFMVEMQEAAQILHYATRNSLIVLDEIGRGTSTYDGVSLAWAILEYIHDKTQAKTLFATHYHELIGVVDKLDSAVNFSVSVKEEEGKIIFLYRVLPGAVDRSYGIEVARLAGLPPEVINKAKNILDDLEEGVLDKAIATRAKVEKEDPNQLNIFADFPRSHRVVEELKQVDIEKLTPLQALQKLDELKKQTYE